MSSPAHQRNIGSNLHGVMGSTARSAVDSGTYVAATFITSTGITISRLALPREFRSCKVIHPIRLDLTTGHVITFGGSMTHSSASGGTYAVLATASTKTFAGATTATSQVSSVTFQASYDLTMAKAFLRVKTTHSGSSTATGSSVTLGTAVVVFGGADETPASSS